ncbi:MAG: protease complex subunit PrcB family protein [Elusimicrobia bacterium]|nr:protease complex subunit PrcB family protein [Elusimicrobiota bacterium]
MKIKALILPLVIAFSSARAAYGNGWERLSGQHSGIAVFRAVVVDNAQSWQRLWQDHQGSLDGLPEVDFSRERVVAVFLGLRHTSGHSVKLEVMAAKDGLVVSYEIHRPKGFTAQVISAPFALLKVPAAPIRMLASGDEARAPRALRNPELKKQLGEASKGIQGLEDRIELPKALFD